MSKAVCILRQGAGIRQVSRFPDPENGYKSRSPADKYRGIR